MAEQDFDPRLLDLHLGHLSTDEQAALRREIAARPELQAQDRVLADALAALRALERVPAAQGLTERIAACVRAAGPAPRVVRPRDALTDFVEQRSERVIRIGYFRDVIAAAALIVLAVGVGVPGLMHMRERSQRLGCSHNLAQLGQGVQQYAGMFNANLPFAGWSGRSSWQPTSEPGVELIPNRRHMYPLLRLAYVPDPRLFICPGQRDVPMPRGLVAQRQDFPEARNVSYAYQNMAGVRPSAQSDPRLPILADNNPLFDDGLPLFDARRIRWGDPAQANSHAHGGAGQNLLTLRGEVIWITAPTHGVDGDNIWTLKHVTEYTGREGPQTATDAHLLK